MPLPDGLYDQILTHTGVRKPLDILQPFLPPPRRGEAWCLPVPPGASLKHVIEACGEPHTEGRFW